MIISDILSYPFLLRALIVGFLTLFLALGIASRISPALLYVIIPVNEPRAPRSL